MATNIKTFRDIDLDFGRHPVTNDINTVANDVAVKRSIRNLVQYNFYEKPYSPKFGANVRGLFFENADIFTKTILQDRITKLIEDHEPRADLESVVVLDNLDGNEVRAIITFTVVNFPKSISLTVYLERLR